MLNGQKKNQKFKNLLIYLKFLETKPLSMLNEDTMAKKQMSPSSASEHAPLLDSAATRLVKTYISPIVELNFGAMLKNGGKK